MRRLLLPALAMGAALLVTACGGGGDDDARGADGPSSSASAQDTEPGQDQDPQPDGGQDGDALPDEGTGAPDEGTPEAPTVPEDELAPPDGEFTEEQREYLTDRVPEGVDPGAILDLGTEACDRLGYLQRHDPESIGAAVRDGEIPGVEDAVTHLCPEYADLLPEGDG
ncbi:hypothetical protein [Streptomyces avicenniae]|uniref:hypothetical protein n=1 Tax=Streptomyces avicenniae TaxID=500153 RepID=UPI00167F1AC2|nr:hypothetical protein [Streptomyces avicenniae]